jgi:AraC-like DNA-binding protein/uncharacterized membrane protein
VECSVKVKKNSANFSSCPIHHGGCYEKQQAPCIFVYHPDFMQFLAIINFTAAIQGIFLAYLLVNRKSNTSEYRVLALLLLTMSLAMLGSVLGLSGYYRQFPQLIRVADPLALLLGPFLYFYIHLLTHRRLPPYAYLHLLPFFVYLLSMLPFYARSGAEKIDFAEQFMLSRQQPLAFIMLQTMRILHVGTYVVISLKLLRKFKHWLEENYSDLGQLHLDKATHLLRLFLFFLALVVGIYLYSLLQPLHVILANNLISLGIAVMIYALAYTTWNRPAPPVLPQQTRSVSDRQIEEKGRATYHLSEQQYQKLSRELVNCLQEEKIYLDSELSLAQLSKKLNILPYQTSELIHRQYQASFFDLINRHRIEEVKRRLNDAAYQHYTILGIAMDCGFNSKSSFNTAFKKLTGLTPSQYRQRK